MKPPAFIFDLDGTIANQAHRLHLVKKQHRTAQDWQEFFDRCKDDTPNEHVVALMRALWFQWVVHRKNGRVNHLPQVLIASGRPDSHETMTKGWLQKHNIPFHQMLMRRAGDTRPDVVAKQEMLRVFQECYRIIGAVDDRPSVIAMWKTHGIPVLEIESQDWGSSEKTEGCYAK